MIVDKIEKTDIKEIEYVSKISDKASTNKCIAEWVDINSEPFVCLALEPSPQKDRRKKKKYTFNMTKCDRIFDILLEEKHIKLSDPHIIPSHEELRGRSYCKWHNMFTHNTNNCNVFRRQLQSAINGGRLKFANHQETRGHKVEKQSPPLSVLKCEDKKVLIRPGKADVTKSKEIMIASELVNYGAEKTSKTYGKKNNVVWVPTGSGQIEA